MSEFGPSGPQPEQSSAEESSENTPEQEAQEQLALPDSELAPRAIGRNIDNVQKDIHDYEKRLKFERGYRQTHPGPRPHEEAGGMDH